MFVYTLTKKHAVRTGIIVLSVIAGIGIGVAAILSSIKTGAAETRLPIYSVERGDNKIALTFDCAWGNSNTDALLDILAKENAKATFFVTGEFAEKFPDDVKKFADAGHEIGNHSDKHPHLKKMNINDIIADTKEAAKKISLATGKRSALYRAPYGEYDTNAVATVEGMGYKFIQWSVDSIDWKEPDAATIIKRAVDKTVSGSILLFHNDLANTTEALPEILLKLKQKGFQFVTVSDLIYHSNYKIDNAGKQIPLSKDSALSSYSNDSVVNDAMEVIHSHFTFDELKQLKNGITPEISGKLASILTEEQIQAVSSMPPDEYTFAYNALIANAEGQSALPVIAGANVPVSGTEPAAEMPAAKGENPETTTAATSAVTTPVPKG